MRNDRALAALMLAGSLAWPLVAFGEAGAAAAPDDTAPRVDVVPTAAAKQAASELMRLQEETLILKAQLKKLDAQAQVVARQESLHRMGGAVSSYADVSLVATQGLGKSIGATVETGDGAQFEVVTGDTLPNGMRVAAIRPGTIVLAAPNGGRTTLKVSSGALQPVRNVAQTAGGDVPPIPSLPVPAR